jgi:3-hydroxyisobutyrate dehydrogenase
MVEIAISQKATIAWVGTGVMGSSMASRLMDAGYAIRVFNRTPSKAKPLLDKGASWADSPAEAVRGAEAVFTILGFPHDVEQVYFGESGIFEGIGQGTILVDMTTSEPTLARRIHDEATVRKCFSLDAPVSGGDVGARNGSLSIMVGGDREAYTAVLGLLEILGKKIVFQGTAGAGQNTKMCNQIVIAGTMIGVCESLLYGYKAGLDLKTMLNSIGGGAAACWSLDNLAPRILDRNFDPGFFVDHFVKDMGIALKEARRMNISLPGLALVEQLYIALQAQGGGQLGTQGLMLALEKLSGLEKGGS